MNQLLNKLPTRVSFALLVCLLQLLVFILFRVAFWAAFQATSEKAPPADLATAFYIGAKFDLRLAMWIVVPVLLLSWLPGLDPVRSRRGRRVWVGYFVVIAAVCSLIYLIDFAHYGWLGSRINAAVLEHAYPVSIAASVVWESYPVVWATLGLLLFLCGFGWGIRRIASAILRRAAGPRSGWARALLGISVAALFVAGITGSFSGYPLRWSHAFFSPNPYTSALGLNPVLYLLDTWSFYSTERAYDVEATRAAYEEVADYLGISPAEREELRFTRFVQPRGRLSGTPNVVVILLESFGANKCGSFGNQLDPTPHFDRIAQESLFFPSFFIASLSTARSIFSLMTGIPDVNPGTSATRNPNLVRQHLMLNDFKGYEKLYFYTGNLAWGNIRGLLQHNIPDLRMYEDGDYSSPRNDSWGISDMHLFEEVNAVLSRIEGKPFFAFIQTSGNHRPYTIPQDRGDFELVEIDDAEILHKNDLRSLVELNGLRFLDYSLGCYLELARKESYFDNTVFLIFGDHGSRGTGSNPRQATGFTSFHVPFVIYGPGFFPEGMVIDTAVSSLDVFPTLAGLLGISHKNTTLGRDMFTPRAEGQDFVFTRTGLLDQEFFMMPWDNRLYRYRSDAPAEDVSARYPDQFKRMKRRWTGLRETARYMLHHNSRDRSENAASAPPSR